MKENLMFSNYHVITIIISTFLFCMPVFATHTHTNFTGIK